ncbi:MAG: RecX family transcriptional regulator [Paludibacteraceae bacterium]|nr:RecX family transcriptional regulator [Paludibacteraceae bacterium]MBR1480532.1 RecX family transcriptional regulator [Paludibacteraceae bacterium]
MERDIIQEMTARGERYCAGAEHCAQDVREKVRQWCLEESHVEGVVKEVAEAVVERLMETGYIDEKRYARAFAHDKLMYQGWGRVKIEAMLRAKDVPQAAIREALESLDEEAYSAVLERLISKRRGDTEERVMRFCMQRGFRYEEVKALLRE